MASMPSLSPNTSTKAEDQRPTPPIPPIRRLSNVNLMTVSPETYLTVDGTQLLKNSPTATVSMLPIPTTSAECTTATGFGDNSADGRVIGPSSAKTRSGLATDELFARSLAPSTNPYQALSVLKNDPSFVAAVKHGEGQNPKSSPFSWITSAFDCCKARKKTLTEDDLKDFEIISNASRTFHGSRRCRAKTNLGSLKFDEDQVDLGIIKPK